VLEEVERKKEERERKEEREQREREREKEHGRILNRECKCHHILM
jgi:hypothetical protein